MCTTFRLDEGRLAGALFPLQWRGRCAGAEHGFCEPTGNLSHRLYGLICMQVWIMPTTPMEQIVMAAPTTEIVLTAIAQMCQRPPASSAFWKYGAVCGSCRKLTFALQLSLNITQWNLWELGAFLGHFGTISGTVVSPYYFSKSMTILAEMPNLHSLSHILGEVGSFRIKNILNWLKWLEGILCLWVSDCETVEMLNKQSHF